MANGSFGNAEGKFASALTVLPKLCLSGFRHRFTFEVGDGGHNHPMAKLARFQRPGVMLAFMSVITWDDIEKEFEESLGYIQNDISALCAQDEKVNYTVALLVGCGCEVMARGMSPRRKPYEVFAELLPPGEWRHLAHPLYEAVRNGLAHRFDTKHLVAQDQPIQIHFGWKRSKVVQISQVSGRPSLHLATRTLGMEFCNKIEDFRTLLQSCGTARTAFRDSYLKDKKKLLCGGALDAWRSLLASQ